MGMKKPWLLVLFALPFLVVCGKKRAGQGGFPLLSKLAPANQYFRIDPAQKNILRADKGSFFTIEADSLILPAPYKPGEKVEIHIIEATRSLEFAAVPVSLEYTNAGKETLFESAGMFYIAANYANEPLRLKPGKTIHVRFRTKISGDKFWVYYYDQQKGWVKQGHNREVTEPVLIAQSAPAGADENTYAQPRKDGQPGVEIRRSRRDRRAPGTKPASPQVISVGAEDSPVKRDPKVAKIKSALYREYEIDSLSWWNFDYPQPTLTCLKGSITGSDAKHFAVTVFSKSELGAYTLYLGKDFKTSFYKNTYARVFVIDENGNVAKTAFFDTPNKTGHHKMADARCTDVGPLKMEKLPDDVVNDADKLQKYLRKESE